MPSNPFHPVLGPFLSEHEIRIAGPDALAYSFPKLVPMSTSLCDALMAVPILANALGKMGSHRARTPATPLVMAVAVCTRQLKTLYPGMNLAPTGIVYRLPQEWALVADQVVRADVCETFGMADLDQTNFRIRASRRIQMPGEHAPTKLLMDLQEHTDIVSQCCAGERGFIGQLVPQIAVCGDDISIGGFFYDRAALEEHLAGIEHMKHVPLSPDSTAYSRALRQAAVVGAQPWRYRAWPVLGHDSCANLVQVTLLH